MPGCDTPYTQALPYPYWPSISYSEVSPAFCLPLSPSCPVRHTIDVVALPVSVAVNEATGRVYVTNSGDDTVSVLGPLILE
jgi:DNA-binding beta-propeller fold protein YncE